MAEKTNPADAAGLALVLEKIKEDHPYPYAYIASELNISRQAVSLWKAVPIRFVAQVERLSGIPRHKILPHKLKQLQAILKG